MYCVMDVVFVFVFVVWFDFDTGNCVLLVFVFCSCCCCVFVLIECFPIAIISVWTSPVVVEFCFVSNVLIILSAYQIHCPFRGIFLSCTCSAVLNLKNCLSDAISSRMFGSSSYIWCISSFNCLCFCSVIVLVCLCKFSFQWFHMSKIIAISFSASCATHLVGHFLDPICCKSVVCRFTRSQHMSLHINAKSPINHCLFMASLISDL